MHSQLYMLWSGCDSTSSFYGIGKKKAYKVVKDSPKFTEAFAQLRNNYAFDSSLFPVVQEMVATLYGICGCDKVNAARYRRFCDKRKAPEPQSLPPTEDELLHCQQVSYVTCLWRSALTAIIDPPQAEGYGWCLTQDGVLNVKWWTRNQHRIQSWNFRLVGARNQSV